VRLRWLGAVAVVGCGCGGRVRAVGGCVAVVGCVMQFTVLCFDYYYCCVLLSELY
jgi:hypothetical protein